jgi:hypothetical protein
LLVKRPRGGTYEVAQDLEVALEDVVDVPHDGDRIGHMAAHVMYALSSSLL